MWSKAKGRMPSLAAGRVEELGKGVGAAFAPITSDDCGGFFKNCGDAAA